MSMSSDGPFPAQGKVGRKGDLTRRLYDTATFGLAQADDGYMSTVAMHDLPLEQVSASFCTLA